MTYLRAYIAFAHHAPYPCIVITGLVAYVIIACLHGLITEDHN